MKLMIDAHLPASLALFFSGHDVLHTSTLPEGNFTPDGIINQISILEDRALITKDSDFYHSYISSRKPYKLILVKLGNMRLRELKAYFERNAIGIVELLEKHSFLIGDRTNKGVRIAKCFSAAISRQRAVKQNQPDLSGNKHLSRKRVTFFCPEANWGHWVM